MRVLIACTLCILHETNTFNNKQIFMQGKKKATTQQQKSLNNLNKLQYRIYSLLTHHTIYVIGEFIYLRFCPNFDVPI